MNKETLTKLIEHDDDLDFQSAEDMVEQLEDMFNYETDEMFKVGEPRYGFDGFDEDYFKGEIKSILDDLK